MRTAAKKQPTTNPHKNSSSTIVATESRALARITRVNRWAILEWLFVLLIFPVVMLFLAQSGAMATHQLFWWFAIVLVVALIVSVPVQFVLAQRKAEHELLDSDDPDMRKQGRKNAQRNIKMGTKKTFESRQSFWLAVRSVFSLVRVVPAIVFVVMLLVFCYSGSTMYYAAWFVGNDTLGYYDTFFWQPFGGLMIFWATSLLYTYLLSVVWTGMFEESSTKPKGTMDKIRAFVARPVIRWIFAIASAVISAFLIAAMVGISVINNLGF